jgi:hypothetical protein
MGEAVAAGCARMIPKSGHRFSEKIMRKKNQILSIFACSITRRHFAISALM